MTEESEKTEGICRESGKTGEKTTCRVQGPPFYHYTLEHRADIYIGIKERYGWDPSGLARVSRVIYTPPDALRSVVAGYVSVKNTDLSGYFPPTEFRMGVELDVVKESLSSRIKAAEKLLENRGGDEVDNTEIGMLALENIEEKIYVLRNAFEQLEGIINQGWTHAILMTAWKDGDKDRLDLNMDFFDVFYPERAFPIAGMTDREIWVHRDVFNIDDFPEGEIVPAHRRGQRLFNRYDYKMESDKFPNLVITFNFARVDIMSQMEEKMAKLVYPSRFPSIEDIIQDIQIELEENFYGAAGDKARRRALRQVARCQRRGMKHAKKKSKKARAIVKKSEECSERLMEGIKRSLVKEHGQLVDELKGIEDVMSPEVDRKVKEGADNIADQQMMGETADAFEDEIFVEARKKYRERGEKQLDDLEEQDPNAKGFGKKVQDLLDTEVKLQGSGDEGLKPFQNISEKLVEGMANMAAGKSDWKPRKFIRFHGQNLQTGGSASLSEGEYELAKQQNYNSLEEQFKKRPIMDRKMKNGINLHLKFFREDIPPSLLKNSNIRAYVKRVKRQMERGTAQPRRRRRQGRPLDIPPRKKGSRAL